ncbi:hypothetical protein TNCV_335391 [Trichonephila clavipes]|nr:hypothetical protein TNCV_335391 [Trichonephila clavipes]
MSSGRSLPQSNLGVQVGIQSSINHEEPDIVSIIKIQRIKRAGHVVKMNEDRNTLKKSSMLHELAHEERAGQILDELMV